MASPLIDNMIERYGYPVLSAETIDAFIAGQDECVLFFTEDPARFPDATTMARRESGDGTRRRRRTGHGGCDPCL